MLELKENKLYCLVNLKKFIDKEPINLLQMSYHSQFSV